MTPISADTRALAQDLLDFIDASPSPWHAVATAAARLEAAGFRPLLEHDRWSLSAGGRHYVRRGASIIAFLVGKESAAEAGFRLVGAHTDSPGLRLKPKAPHHAEGMMRLGVEVYGGPILATFTDRDLSLAGQVQVRTAEGFASRLVKFDRPLVRLPNLAIHMNREVNDQGLKLHKTNELPLLFSLAGEGDPTTRFRALLADALAVPAADIMGWELAAYDTQKGSFWGPEGEFYADSQLDNLSSCHAGLTALLRTQSPAATCLCALLDHEEVGSGSATGAGGSFIADVLTRLCAASRLDDEDRARAYARSFFVSADMAHAWHPNFPAAYDPGHHLLVNAGPVIKHNASQKYTTGGESAARFKQCCEKAGVPYQEYVHRTDLGCGSTIGPIVAAQLGMAAVDVGSPMWAMHSIRESAGVLDQSFMAAALTAAFASR